MTADDAADGAAVRATLAAFDPSRGPGLVRRFEHGVGGTSLIELDGALRVLKAWRLREGDEARLDSALQLAEIARLRGVPVPALLERGHLGAYGYLVYDHLDGEWPARLESDTVDDLLAVIDAARDAAPGPNHRWVDELATMLDRGDDTFDIDPSALAGSAAAEVVLQEARRRLGTCHPAELRTTDIVHGDFAPENLLVRAGRVVGVVDWERARVGDAGLDLVGAIFDIAIGDKTTPPLTDRLWQSARDRMQPEVLAAYVGVYAVRYLSWSVRTDMEEQVLDLARHLLHRSAVPGTA